MRITGAMGRIAAAAALAAAAAAAAAGPERWRGEWPATDFSVSAVADWGEIISGGPPKDGIPALSGPRFAPAAQETRLSDREPVITVDIGDGTPRAYPIRYLIWHEIVNDEVGGVPVAVTYCPLCNSAMVFDRRVDGTALEFGVSGKLRHSDMIMYDRQTESWWQQAVGVGIVGRHTGAELVQLPSWMESWGEFRRRSPQGLVMDQPALPRQYGRNPYAGYDSSARPFLFRGELPPNGVAPLMRVVRVGDRAWTLERLRREEQIAEAGVTISWRPGQASALDTAEIAGGRDVGSIRVRDADGADVPHDLMFAFAFHAFFPDGRWMLE